jgi:hypothetical protein
MCSKCTCKTFSEPKCHPFRNDASHIKLWDAWFLNFPAFFEQPENCDHCMLSGI